MKKRACCCFDAHLSFIHVCLESEIALAYACEINGTLSFSL